MNGSYKFTLKTSADVLVKETDNVTAFTSSGSSVDSITTTFTEDVVTTADSFIFSDASDGGTTKRDTIQGILDLAGTGALVYLGSATASASATLDFTSLLNSSIYTAYMFVFNDILPATNSTTMMFRTSSNNGSSYDTGPSNYSYVSGNNGATYAGTSNNNSADGQVTVAASFDTSISNNSINGYSILYVGSSKYSYMESFVSSLIGSNTIANQITNCSRLSTTAVNAIRFFMSAGNITSGTIRLYGVKKS